MLFAFYVSIAITAAARQHSHLAVDVVARNYPARVRRWMSRFAAIVVVPAVDAVRVVRRVARYRTVGARIRAGFPTRSIRVISRSGLHSGCLLAVLTLTWPGMLLRHDAPPADRSAPALPSLEEQRRMFERQLDQNADEIPATGGSASADTRN